MYSSMLLEGKWKTNMTSLTMKQKINAFKGMTIRNVKMYFKDKGTVFFSLLAPLIILGLYIIFLKNQYIDGIMESISGFGALIQEKDIDSIANTWLLAGILSTCTITVALNSLSVMVSDKEKRVDYDFNSSPCYGVPVILSYFAGAFISTLLVSLIILTIGLALLAILGTVYLTFINILTLLLITVIACASSTMIMMVIASFFKKSSALGAFGGLVSAAIGFVVGAYIPLGQFSNTAQSVMGLIPGSQIATLYRDVMMSGSIEHVASALGNGANDFVENMNKVFSISLNMFGFNTTKLFSYLYAIGAMVVAFGINILIYKKTSKRV